MNIIITSDNLRRSLTINLRSWRAPALVLILVIAIIVATYHTAVNIAEAWVRDNDARIAHLVEKRLAAAAAARDALWRSTIDRLDQEATDLHVRLWRIASLGNEIADRLGLAEEIKVEVADQPSPLEKIAQELPPTAGISLLETRLIQLNDSIENEALRLILIGNNSAAVAMQRSTLPMREPIEGKRDGRRKTYWRTSGYGMRSDPFTGRRAFHSGYDFASRRGTPVLAGANGIVTHRSRLGNYGKMIEIYHGEGISTLYGHLSNYRTELGQFVNRGQIIGLVGSTGRSSGPHLHYEVRKNGKPQSYSKIIKEMLSQRPLVALAPPADLLLQK